MTRIQQIEERLEKSRTDLDYYTGGLMSNEDVAYLIGLVKKYREALEWIMPKVHQGNHEGSLADCQKLTCQEYRKALESEG